MFILEEDQVAEYGKICTRCQEWCFWEQFPPNTRAKDHRDSRCHRCRADVQSQRRLDDPEKSKEIRKRHYYKYQDKHKAYGITRNKSGVARALKYGLTLEQLDGMYEAQDYRCAWCGRHESECPKQKLCVDHDHDCCPGYKSCGKCVRRLLCDDCNMVEGRLRNASGRKDWPHLRLSWYTVRVNRKDITPEVIRRWAEQNTKASAAIEGRVIPDDYVRSPRIQEFLDKRLIGGYKMEKKLPVVRAGFELWENMLPGTVWVETTLDEKKGTTRVIKVQGKGSYLRLLTEDRRLTQERVLDKKNDPFVNGTLVRVDTDQQSDEETASDSAKSDLDLRALLTYKQVKKFTESIDQLSEVSLRRLKSLLDGDNATANQMTWVNDMIEAKFGVNRGKDPSLRDAPAETIAATFPEFKLS